MLKHEILPFSTGIFALCPEKQSYHFQEGKGLQRRGNRNCPHGCPPSRGKQAGAENKCCVKKESQTSPEAPGWRGWAFPGSSRTLRHAVREQRVVLKHTHTFPSPLPASYTHSHTHACTHTSFLSSWCNRKNMDFGIKNMEVQALVLPLTCYMNSGKLILPL